MIISTWYDLNVTHMKETLFYKQSLARCVKSHRQQFEELVRNRIITTRNVSCVYNPHGSDVSELLSYESYQHGYLLSRMFGEHVKAAKHNIQCNHDGKSEQEQER